MPFGDRVDRHGSGGECGQAALLDLFGQLRCAVQGLWVAAGGQPVGEHPVAALGEHRLRVELHALDRQRRGAACAITTPESVRPVTSSSSGRVSGSTAREW